MSPLLATARLATLFDGLADRRRLLVAVSGGPDSLALLHLVRRWAEAEAGRPAIEAATVDHGLRAESREEAQRVAGWTSRLGVPHAILPWAGPKPTTRLQERARDARYALLSAHARAIGADTLLTAHHADDQAETILFRLTRGSGVAGLAGMARVAARDGLMQVRPLLDLPKADLVALCVDRGQDFVRDPSNDDPRFARVQLRQLAATLDALGLSAAALLRLGRRAARSDAALEALTTAIEDPLSCERAAGQFTADFSGAEGVPIELLIRLIAREAARIGGQRPRLDRLEAFMDRLIEAKREGRPCRATLAGTLIDLGAGGRLTIQNEPPRCRVKETTQSPRVPPRVARPAASNNASHAASLGKRVGEA